MQFIAKRWVQVAILVAILAIGSTWLKGPFQTTQSKSTAYVSESVPAPSAGQKKVVLRNLGMT